jgi:hypothetical protein
MTSRLRGAFSLLLASMCVTPAPAQSLGHYHLPSTLPQFCGLGYGPGHHVPMIRPTGCHPPRIQRYVRVPGCGACGALPMECFPTCASPGCHQQLDQLLQSGEYDQSPVTPTEAPLQGGIAEPSETLPTLPYQP